MVGHGVLEGFLAVNANGRSGGVVIAWNEMVSTKVASRMGQFSVAVKLQRNSDDLEMIVLSINDPTYVRRRTELWGELAEVATTFQGSPIFMGGVFDGTIEAMNRQNNAGGQDLDSKDLRSFITKAMLQEIGPVNCEYPWRSTNRNTMPSQLDRFLCSIELADVHVLSRSLFDLTPIEWMVHEGQI